MSGFSYVGAVLTAAALLSAPVLVLAQTPAQKAAASLTANHAYVEHVIVRGTGAATEVEIQTSGTPIAPDTQALTGPDRIVVDFPGALPAAELRALRLNHGPLRAVRSGLFFRNPPITRIVLDLRESHSYTISTNGNNVVLKLGQVTVAGVQQQEAPTPAAAKLGVISKNTVSKNAASKSVGSRSVGSRNFVSRNPELKKAELKSASLAGASPVPSTKAAVDQVSATVANAPQPQPAEVPPPPPVTVTYANGLLRIYAERATLSQVLFEVQRQTQAEIAIPAGAEQEQVVADLGPAPAREVLTALLNGSSYNFIFVGNELSLERVILTRRDPNIF